MRLAEGGANGRSDGSAGADGSCPAPPGAMRLIALKGLLELHTHGLVGGNDRAGGLQASGFGINTEEDDVVGV